MESPLDGEGEVMRLALADGAVASSSTQRRRWRVGHEDRHHLLDPRTGLPIDNGLASVTAVAGEAWWAEVLTKAAMVAGPREGASLLTLLGGAGLLVRDDGGVSTSGGLEEFLR